MFLHSSMICLNIAKYAKHIWYFCYVQTDPNRMQKHKTRWMHTALHCNTLQYTATHFHSLGCFCLFKQIMLEYEKTTTCVHTATHCNTLQYTATHFVLATFSAWCSNVHTHQHVCTLHYTALHCNTQQHTLLLFFCPWKYRIQQTTTHCITLH